MNREEMCQCPKRANLHFYLKNKKGNKNNELCQCPKRANLHFYLGLQRKGIHTQKDVSMP